MRDLQIIYETRKGEKKLSCQVPEEWNELSRKQLLFTMLVFSRTDHHRTRQHHLLQNLLQLPDAEFDALPPWVLYELRSLTRFLLEDEPAKPFTKQLLPVVRPYGFSRRYYGPADLLVNLSFAEFIAAESYLFRYLQKQDAASLHGFIATLYRPQRWFHSVRKRLGDYTGDNREPFNEHLVAGRAKHLAKLPVTQKAAILAWYKGCRSMLERLYPEVFSVEGEESQSSKASSWEPVLRGMAGGKFGDVRHTAKVQAHQILAEMNEQLQQAKEIKRKHKTT